MLCEDRSICVTLINEESHRQEFIMFLDLLLASLLIFTPQELIPGG
jgi:hypothetical protein